MARNYPHPCAVIARKFPRRSGHFDTDRNSQIVPAGAYSRDTISRLRVRQSFTRPCTRGASTMATARAGNRPKPGETGRIDRRPETSRLIPPGCHQLRRNGRFGRICHDRSKRKIGDSRGLKIEIAPLYVDMRTSIQKYTYGQMNVSFRNGLSPCWQARFDG